MTSMHDLLHAHVPTHSYAQIKKQFLKEIDICVYLMLL